MRVMISSDGSTAHFFIRKGWASAFSYAGHETILWDIKTKNAFDAFDEFEPDLFIGQTYNIDESLIKCISARPEMKVIMKAPDWGDIQKDIDPEKYNVLFVSDKDKHYVEALKRQTGKPDFVFAHYTQKCIERTHNGWENLGVRSVGLLNAADIFDYTNGREIPHLRSDMSFVGGYWGYKSKSFNRYFMPFLYPVDKYNVKIFGNQPWPSTQYLGFVSDGVVKDVMASATICPNISEPHAQDFGIDINERTFKILSNRCFCISDYVSSLAEEVYTNNEVPFAKTPEEFFDLVNHFLNNPRERLEYIERGYETVINKHTYFHRVMQICGELSLEKEKTDCKQALVKFMETRV